MRLKLTRRAQYLLVFGICIVALSASALLDEPGPTAWAALAAALPALAISVLALGRLQRFEFCPEVLAGDVILPRPSRPGEGLRLLLPMQFTNSGHADGIVEWVALRLTVDGDAARSILLRPVADIDMQRFIQAKRRLAEEASLDPFVAFPLEAKRAVAKFVLFDLAERPRVPALQLRPGRYAFELFVKATSTRHPKLERTFEHVVEDRQIEEYRSGAAVYLINYQITLPGARRALADSEWLPAKAA